MLKQFCKTLFANKPATTLLADLFFYRLTNMSFMNKSLLPKYSGYLLFGTGIVLLPFIYFTNTLDPALAPRFFLMSLVLLLVFIITTATNIRNAANALILRRGIFYFFGGYLCISLYAMRHSVNLADAIFDVSKIALAILFLFIATPFHCFYC